MPHFLTTTEAAEFLNVHPNTIRSWIAHGILKAVRLNPSGRLLIQPEAIQEAIDKGRLVDDDDEDFDD